MAFDPLEFKIQGEARYKGVLYIEPFFGSNTIPQIEAWRADSTDIIIASYPKTGTTWMGGILKELLNLEGDALPIPMNLTIPYMEWTIPSTLSLEHADFKPTLDVIKSRQPPRALKTHLIFDLLKHIVAKDKAKIILMLRNPKDTLVSYFYHNKNLVAHGNFPGDFHDFFVLFKAKRLIYGDVFDWYKGWWEHKDLPNVLVVRYEDLQKDPETSVKRVAEFVGRNMSEDGIRNVIKGACSKKMGQVNLEKTDKVFLDYGFREFFRKGDVGDWKNHFNDEENEYIDRKCAEILEPLGLTFDYEQI